MGRACSSAQGHLLVELVPLCQTHCHELLSLGSGPPNLHQPRSHPCTCSTGTLLLALCMIVRLSGPGCSCGSVPLLPSLPSAICPHSTMQHCCSWGNSLQLSMCPMMGPGHDPRCVKEQNTSTCLLGVLPAACHILVLLRPLGTSWLWQLPFSSAILRFNLLPGRRCFISWGELCRGCQSPAANETPVWLFLSLTSPSAFIAGRSPSFSLRLM